jgi:hypothetical protein
MKKPETSTDKPETPNRVGSMRLLGDVDPSYQCVMVNPPKKKWLKSQKVIYTYEGIRGEMVSTDKHGKAIPNTSTKFFLRTKLVGIRWPKKRKKRKSPNVPMSEPPTKTL